MNHHYPIMVDLTHRACLVVGGGEVATRKIESLMHAGAKVTVISPDAFPDVVKWAEAGEIIWHKEPYTVQSVRGYALVIAATNRPEVNLAVYEAVQKEAGWINMVDRPDLCNYIVPSAVQRGKLVISISTSGASPSLARKIRQKLEADFGVEYESYVDFLADMRKEVLQVVEDAAQRKRIFRSLLAECFLHASETEREEMAQALLEQYKTTQEGRHE